MGHSYYWLPQVFQTTTEVFFPSSKENVLTGYVLCFKAQHGLGEQEATTAEAEAPTRA